MNSFLPLILRKNESKYKDTSWKSRSNVESKNGILCSLHAFTKSEIVNHNVRSLNYFNIGKYYLGKLLCSFFI